MKTGQCISIFFPVVTSLYLVTKWNKLYLQWNLSLLRSKTQTFFISSPHCLLLQQLIGNLKEFIITSSFALLAVCQLRGVVKSWWHGKGQPWHHSGGWWGVLVSNQFMQLLQSSSGVYVLLQNVMMHFWFTSTGCRSQTGASSLQMQMFAVLSILPW